MPNHSDDIESTILKWCPRRDRNNSVAAAPAPTPIELPAQESRAAITEAELLRGYEVDNLRCL